MVSGTAGQIQVQFNAPAGGGGGFLVMHSDIVAGNADPDLTLGTLTAPSGSVSACKTGSGLCGGATTFNGGTEVVQASPQKSTSPTFTFGYTPPTVGLTRKCGVFNFILWANQVNGDSKCFLASDNPVSVSFTITVGCPDEDGPNHCHGARSGEWP
jgi:hypothetical protein